MNAKKSVTHCQFVCKLCTTEIDLPLCCEKDSIEIKDGKLMCRLCGSQKQVPVCCGKEVVVAGN